MAKYLSKTLYDCWWNTEAVKQLPDRERRAALYYECLAREVAVGRSFVGSRKIVYLWEKRWIDLSDEVRHMIVTFIWPLVTPSAVMIDPFPGLDLSFVNNKRMRQVWSETLPLQFNLMASKKAVRAEIGRFFDDLQKTHGYQGHSLELRKSRQLSFRPLDILNRKLQGHRLTRTERDTIRSFRIKHHDELHPWGRILYTLYWTCISIEALKAQKKANVQKL